MLTKDRHDVCELDRTVALRDGMEVRLRAIHPGDERHLAIIAERKDSGDHARIGVARYSVGDGDHPAGIGLVVDDAWQGSGLGTVLLHAIMRAGEARGIRSFRVTDSLVQVRR
jgi:GNAT superfamily N-acetyltransferase